MLSNVFKRNLLTTSNFRCISKANNNSASADDKSTPQINVSEINELDANANAFICTNAENKSTTRERSARPSLSIRKLRSINYQRTNQGSEEASVILFPGQGSQFVGMAKGLTKYPQAMDLFEIASEILRYDLLKLCTEGPEHQLDQLIYSQPAVMVTSLAALELLKMDRPNAIESCVATAGFSLGEITALVFAGAIPFDRAVRLVQIRGEAMQMACDTFDGGMATVLIRHDSQLKEAMKTARDWCVERGVVNPTCVVAYDLFPDCKVISGSTEALRYIEKNLARFKLAKIQKIPGCGAFHTDLMESVVEPFAKELKRIPIEEPFVDVYSNITGKRYKNADYIQWKLPQQIVNPVKWEQIMHLFYDGIKDAKKPDTFICGPGNALKTILKNVNAIAANTVYKYGE